MYMHVWVWDDEKNKSEQCPPESTGTKLPLNINLVFLDVSRFSRLKTRQLGRGTQTRWHQRNRELTLIVLNS